MACNWGGAYGVHSSSFKTPQIHLKQPSRVSAVGVGWTHANREAIPSLSARPLPRAQPSLPYSTLPLLQPSLGVKASLQPYQARPFPLVEAVTLWFPLLKVSPPLLTLQAPCSPRSPTPPPVPPARIKMVCGVSDACSTGPM